MPPPTPAGLAALRARPEPRLLLDALRPDTSLEAAVARAAADGVDWGAAFRLMRSHRLVPHLAAALAGQPGVPEPARASLRRTAEGAALRQLRMAAALDRVLGALGAAGVPALPLKGPALAAWLFGDVAGRASVDLDVLVEAARLGEAVAAVRALGFEGAGGLRLLAPGEAAVVAREFALKDASFRHPGLDVALELHWRPFRDRGLEALTGALRAGLRTDHASPPAPGPPAAVAAFVLAHGAFHGYRRLTWLVDAAALGARLEAPAWAEALRLAEADGVRAAVLLGPHLADALLGVAPPAPLRPALGLEARRLGRLAARCPTATPDATGRTDADRLALQAGLYDRRLDRARFALRYLVRPAEGELEAADLRRTPLARARRRLARPARLAANAARWVLGGP